jgi:hypothetical protein
LDASIKAKTNSAQSSFSVASGHRSAHEPDRMQRGCGRAIRMQNCYKPMHVNRCTTGRRVRRAASERPRDDAPSPSRPASASSYTTKPRARARTRTRTWSLHDGILARPMLCIVVHLQKTEIWYPGRLSTCLREWSRCGTHRTGRLPKIARRCVRGTRCSRG